MSRKEVRDLNIKSWLTLEHLMHTLNLKKEFEILFDSHQQKLQKEETMNKWKKVPEDEIEQAENEHIIKVLIRCKKMYECYQEIVRILVKVKKRRQLIQQF